ncbi:hypothetical protein NDU88_007508 [Pleurodeles waltl]|uniref:Uncharacterized protein n=1 Tax=Pleurodeles waltl TaxID=8319 RepID=A0AAV7VSW4_PLEWA|nr:hypothetical protein NDU88_007508 [Pleurodeles waltl]
MFFPDYTIAVQRQGNHFLTVKQRLRETGITNSLLFPFKLRVAAADNTFFLPLKRHGAGLRASIMVPLTRHDLNYRKATMHKGDAGGSAGRGHEQRGAFLWPLT